jgi:c-di-GMP-binding flagellar brake protein YcgR
MATEPDRSDRAGGEAVAVSQQREYVRLKAKRPVLVYVGSDRRQVQTYAVELAGGGLLLAGPDVLEVGEEVEFQLSLAAGSEPVVGMGRVVRSDIKGHRAITFNEMSELNRRRVVRFIFATERAERRRMLEADERDGN